MNTQDFPDFEDRYIGYAILALMTFVMYAWITSSSSPIPNFAYKSNVSAMLGHFEILLFVVIPFALMGLIHSLNPKSKIGNVSNRATRFVNRANARAVAYRQMHSAKLKYAKKNKSDGS